MFSKFPTVLNLAPGLDNLMDWQPFLHCFFQLNLNGMCKFVHYERLATPIHFIQSKIERKPACLQNIPMQLNAI
jgi:hypothetical protein